MTSALPRTSSVPPSTKRGKRSCVQGRKLVPCMRSTLGPRGVVDPSRHRISPAVAACLVGMCKSLAWRLFARRSVA